MLLKNMQPVTTILEQCRTPIFGYFLVCMFLASEITLKKLSVAYQPKQPSNIIRDYLSLRQLISSFSAVY